MLSRGGVGVILIPTRVLDPLAPPPGRRRESSAESRYVGLELRATNLGHDPQEISAENLSVITTQRNRALEVAPGSAGGRCRGRSAFDLTRIGPASTKTACFAFEVETGERLKDVRIAVGEAVGVWSLQ